jgi:hypothetical protein
MQTTIALLAGLLATIAVLAGAALVRWILRGKAQRVDPRPQHRMVSTRVSPTLLLAAIGLTLGFAAMYFQPARMAALMGQQQAGGGCTSVWVNTRSHVYHFDETSSHGRDFYGHTRQGIYMCEADARVAGNRAAFDERHP